MHIQRGLLFGQCCRKVQSLRSASVSHDTRSILNTQKKSYNIIDSLNSKPKHCACSLRLSPSHLKPRFEGIPFLLQQLETSANQFEDTGKSKSKKQYKRVIESDSENSFEAYNKHQHFPPPLSLSLSLDPCLWKLLLVAP